MSKIICGLDEVGRGALAGPLVLCGVIFKNKSLFDGKVKNFVFRDSKKMTKLQRIKTHDFLVKNVLFEIEVIEAVEINKNGIGWANKEGFERLVLKLQADSYIVDGNLKFDSNKFGKGKNVKSIIKADNLVDEVKAASIIAKVTRDNMMHKLHNKFTDYDFLNNVGYGTRKHIEAVKKLGKTKHHRDLFLRKII